MNTMLSIPPAGIGAGNVGTRTGGGHAARSEDSRCVAPEALPHPVPTRPEASKPGVHASFSPQSLRALENTALDIAHDAEALVQGIGKVGAEAIAMTAQAVEAAGSGASELVVSGAEALVWGIDTVCSGVNVAADVAEEAMTEAAGLAGEGVKSVVGYAALAALAGGALLNELA